MAEFSDTPRFSGKTWREITRWLRRNGFENVEPQKIWREGCANYTDSQGGSAIWLRRREGLMVEAVRLDVLGHSPNPRFKDATLQKKHATLAVGFGEPRHVHKEAFPPAEEELYRSQPTPHTVKYNDANVVTLSLADAHIWINP